MKFLNSGNVVRLKLTEIAVGSRLRRVSPTQVENLLLMAEDTGITTPIHVRKQRDGYSLIDGAHRLEATRRLGLDDIAALVVECRQDEARAMEASNNLGAARMSPLHTAVFAASWKRDYYAMHPDRKPGVFKGNQHSGNVVEETISLTRSVAETFAISERHARSILRAGEHLGVAEIGALERAPRPVAMKDLMDLSKITEAEERTRVVQLLSLGECKSAAEARRRLKAESEGVDETVKDAVEEAFKALSKAWARAPLAAKKRFLLDHKTEVWSAQNKGVPLTQWREAVE